MNDVHIETANCEIHLGTFFMLNTVDSSTCMIMTLFSEQLSQPSPCSDASQIMKNYSSADLLVLHMQ